MKENEFRGPMKPWPGLEKFGQSVELPISDVRLFYYDSGVKSGTVLLLIHGLGDEADTWRHVFAELSTHVRVIAPDLPGFGRSGKPHIQYSLTFLTQTLLEFIDQLEIKKPIWIGNSLGAILSQSIALDFPERVQGLVLIDGSMIQSSAQKASLTQFLFLIPGVGRWMYNRLRKNPQSAYGTLQPYYYDLDGMPEADRSFLYQRVNQRVWDIGQREAYLSTLRNMVIYLLRNQKQFKERLPQIKAPTVIVWGEADQVSNVENGRYLNSVLPAARLITFPKTGHLVQQERPHELLKAIMEDERFDIKE